jgi:uncharacterized protein (DUF2236 family)
MSFREWNLDRQEAQPGPLNQEVASPEEASGWFDQDSMIRRINREALSLLGGGCAVLLQLAHPAVAAGVAQHSYFQSDPLTRLLRTLEFIHILVFGSQAQARQAVRQFHTMHARIQGQLPETAGRFAEGSAYTARDPELKLWVYATLVEASLLAYERFVEPLSPDQRHRYYADTRLLARQLAIPEQLIPPTLDDFRAYMDTMLASDALAVTGATRQLGRDALVPRNVGAIPAITARLLFFVTAGLLPERLREAYGLKWGKPQQRALQALGWTTRLLRPWMPAWVWQNPLLEGRLPRFFLGLAVKETHSKSGTSGE